MKNPINFNAGKMNKDLDLKMIPAGEYVDAENIRVYNQSSGSGNLGGSVTSDLGTTQIPPFVSLTAAARVIGAFSDEANDTIYWFVVDSGRSLVLSFNVVTSAGIVHIDDAGTPRFNFSEEYPIVSVSKVDEFLFWTDGFNPPRYINVKKCYDPTSYGLSDVYGDIDAYTCVIKTPPPSAPTVQLINDGTESNYLFENMVSFAYRYRYDDNMYSALSQFTNVAFDPRDFAYNSNTGLNDGMKNTYNSADVTVDTGGLAIAGIDIVFKRFSSNTIYLIERVNTSDIPTYSPSYTIRFQNNKMYSVLPSDEILRLYDNVPISSRSQTLAGNRLIYGNYFDGRDLKDSSNNDIKLTYTPTALNEEVGSVQSLTTALGNQTIYVGSLGPTLPAVQRTLANSLATITIPLAFQNNILPGFSFGFSANIVPVSQAVRSGGVEYPLTPTTPQFAVEFSFTAQKYYANFLQMVTSNEFAVALGSDISTYQWPITNCSNGYSLSDRFSCQIVSPFTYSGTNRNKDSLSNSLGLTGPPPNPNYCSFSVGPVTISGITPVSSVGTTITVPSTARLVVGMNIVKTSGTGTLATGGDVITAILSPTTFSVAVAPTVALSGATITATPTSAFLQILIPQVSFANASTGVLDGYALFSFSNFVCTAGYQKAQLSLHSNRDYQVGIVYMDKNHRASPVLVSKNNSVYFQSASSTRKNYIQVDIPASQRPPSWATKYKFVVQPTKERYDTFYGRVFYTDPSDKNIWIKLEGEFQKTVSVGQKLIVKKDTNGPLSSLVDATVLATEVQPSNFISGNVTPSGASISELPGFYAKFKAEKWSASYNQDSFSDTGLISNRTSRGVDWSFVNIPLFQISSTGIYSKYDVPAGSIVDIYIFCNREGRYCSGYIDCGKVSSVFSKRYIASASYPDIKAFWDGEGVDVTTAIYPNTYCVDDAGENAQEYDNTMGSSAPYTGSNGVLGKNRYKFWTSSVNSNALYLSVQNGSLKCSWPGERNPWIDAQIKIQRTDSVIVFETLPEEAVPELYYENEQSFDIVSGNHQGNIQNQTSTLPAISTLSFSNCVSFGNGVESMSIEDSITGDYLKLGHRVHSISTGYKLSHRFSDMTYSGVYNRESNVNNLNEFNLGLLNFKTLEPFYGSIQYMYPRESDILVFQEDKVSKVLFGKNILSDAVGGSVLASVPQVLGNQIPRQEEYGIDIYPETFAVYGDKIYFTDAKRGAVIQMLGESMTRISDIGMISYFRNALINNNGVKRAGYDPYMRDYVFYYNDPVAAIENVTCGSIVTISDVDDNYPGTIIRAYYTGSGSITIDLARISGQVLWEAWYNGSMIDSGLLDGATPTYSFSEPVDQSQEYIEVRISGFPNTTGGVTVDISCPSNPTVVPIMLILNDGSDAGKMATQIVGPSLIQNYQFEAQLNSIGEQFFVLSPTQLGTQMLPTIGGNFDMYTAVYPSGFSPNTTDSRFKFLSSNTLYGAGQGPTVSGLATSRTLVADNNSFSPIPAFKSNSSITYSTNLAYAYFVWDYRTQGISIDLCESASLNEVCCAGCGFACPYMNTNAAYSAYAGFGICNSQYNLVIYRSANTLAVNDKLMLNPAATIPAPPGWYKVFDGAGGNGKVAQVGALGVISLIQTC